jgi:hypothetical protein
MRAPTRSGRGRLAAVLVALAVGGAGLATVPATPAGAACPTLGPSARWLFPYTQGGSNGLWSEGFLASSGTTVTGHLTSINGGDAFPNEVVGTLSCGSFTGTLRGIDGNTTNIPLSAVLLPNGDELVDGIWSGGNTWSGARVQHAVEATDAVELTTDPDSSGATPAEPVQVGVTSPVAGDIAISTASAANPVTAGYQLMNQIVHIEAPSATPEEPLVFQFVLDASTILGGTAADIGVFRNGFVLANCSPTAGTAADPDPCVASRVVLPGGDVRITVRTADASTWAFGVRTTRLGFRILTAGLPGAQLGKAYNVTLKASGGTAPFKWKKLTKLPKGLKLKGKTGVLSGTPKKVRGSFVLDLQVRDKAKPKRIATKRFTIVVN